MKISKIKLKLAFLPLILSISIGIVFLYIASINEDFIQVAYVLISIVLFVLAIVGIKPIVMYFKKVKILNYVEIRYSDLLKFRQVIKENDNSRSVYKNPDGTPSMLVKDAATSLNELGYQGETLIDMLYDEIITVDQVITPIEMLINETLRPFKRIPYQFLMLER